MDKSTIIWLLIIFGNKGTIKLISLASKGILKKTKKLYKNNK